MGLQKTIQMDVTMSEELWPYKVVNEIQKVMEKGEAKGKSGWENVPVVEHVHRAYDHLTGYFCDDRTEDHLTRAFCRLMMAVAIERGYVKPEEGRDA